MWKWIRDRSSPPYGDDPETRRRSAILHHVLVGTFLVCLAHTLLSIGLMANPGRAFGIGATVTLLVLVSMGLVHKGRQRAAMVLVCATFWLAVTLSAVLILGVNTPILSVYVAVAVLVGFFAGRTALISYSVATSGFILAAAWAGERGLLPEPSGHADAYAGWLMLTSGLVITSILISLSRRNAERTLGEALQSRSDAVEATHQLEASSALLATRAREQATIAELGQLALADTSLSALIEVASKAVAETLEVDLVTIFESTPDRSAFRLHAGLGWAEESAGSAVIPAEYAVTAVHAVNTGEPVIVEDWGREERFPQSPGLRELGVMSSIAVAIRGTDAPYGVFAAHAKRPREYTDDDVRFVQSVANLLTLVRRREETDDALERSQESLRQAQKMEAIGQFAGGIAHDFNNMLTAISGYNEMIMRQMPPGDPARRDAEEIAHAAERAAALTQQILAFSRRQLLQPEVLDLNAVVRKTKGMLERIIGEDVALVISLDPDLELVRADPSQIEQVLLNLAANARDAMPRGGRLEIETRNVRLEAEGPQLRHAREARPHVRVTITDTGSGMDAATQAQIFEPFFTTKDLSQGTGLGLATVYGIVKQSGGEIEVESEPGRFSRFVIHLPVCEEAKESASASGAPIGLPRGSETVLLAEDEEVVRRLTRRMLEELGYAVLEARNGAEALHLAKAHDGPIPLLVTDVIMPEMGGAELADRLAALRPEARVVYVSGYAAEVLDEPHLERANAIFLHKPFSQEELAHRLRELLDGSEATVARA